MHIGESGKTCDISHLTYWYQPIYQLNTGSIHGYEALVRSKHNYSINPAEIIKRARFQGKLTILDCQLLLKAQQQFSNAKTNVLFLNVCPSTLLDRGFIEWWKKYSSSPCNIVLEVQESEPISDWDILRTIVRELKDMGVKIAIDDIGAGYSFLQHWIELEPEYIKLDRYYMKDLALNSIKQKVLESIVKLVGDTTKVIVEGVEDYDSLAAAWNLGVEYAQGFFLGMPAPIEKYEDQDLSKEIYKKLTNNL